MIAKITIVSLINFVSAQMNGEFWWLNDKLEKYRVVPPPPPKFENLSEFDTDESAKIIFKDNDLLSFSDNSLYRNKYQSEDHTRNKEKKVNENKIIFGAKHKPKSINLKDESKIVWPKDDEMFVNLNKSNLELFEDKKVTFKNQTSKKSQDNEDILEFKFPGKNNSIFWKSTKQNFNNTDALISFNEPGKSNCTDNKNSSTVKPIKVVSTTQKLPISVLQTQDQETESICTYLSKLECDKRSGTVYKKRKVISHLVCCILPLSFNDSYSKIHFIEPNKRYRRSYIEDKINPALKQRNVLLTRKYGPQVLLTAKPPTTTTAQISQITHKTVSQDDDYGITDPYWNIKNSEFKKPALNILTQQTTSKRYDYESEDYEEEYAAELPRPGLVGLYSDHAGSAPNWSFINGEPGFSYANGFNSNDDTEPSFVYGATINPRSENRIAKVTSRPSKQTRPPRQPLTVFSSKEINSYDFETQTITYDADPEFNVLNGFKLLNFKKRKTKYNRNKTQIVTSESGETSDIKEAVLIDSDSLNDDEEDVFDTNQNVMKNCGKAPVDDFRSDRNIGEAKRGSHPWLGIVVLTRKPQTILCYATLVNARAALTAADCVHGRASCPGEVTLIAGVWDLTNEGQENWQKRLATVHLHEDYTPTDLANNLAILYWKRPLRLNTNVQPACLSDPHVGDTCRFYGWSGYDQAMRPRSRWQKASVLTPRQCSEKLITTQETIPSDSFCAAVHTRGTVTGSGAPLICLVGGRHTASGVAIWRDHVVLLAPAQQWTMDTLSHLDLL